MLVFVTAEGELLPDVPRTPQSPPTEVSPYTPLDLAELCRQAAEEAEKVSTNKAPIKRLTKFVPS